MPIRKPAFTSLPDTFYESVATVAPQPACQLSNIIQSTIGYPYSDGITWNTVLASVRIHSHLTRNRSYCPIADGKAAASLYRKLVTDMNLY